MTRASDLAKLLGAGATILDGTTISTADNDPQLILTSTDADGDRGPVVQFTRDSGSPADNDVLGRVQFLFDNDAAEVTTAVQIEATATDVSNGTEDSALNLVTMVDGNTRGRLKFTSSEAVFNEDSIDSDFRVESDASSYGLFLDGGSGHVGVHAQPTTTSSVYKGIQTGLGGTLLGRSDDTPLYLSSNVTYTDNWKYLANTTGSQIELGTNIQFYTIASGTAGNTATRVERMRIVSSGNVLVGTTDQSPAEGTNVGIRLGGNGTSQFSSSGDAGLSVNRTSDNGNVMTFRRDGNLRGRISVDGSSTSYITSSDYRLKENIVDMTNATAKLKQLKPKRFNFISDADKTVDGFLAHEVQTVVPEAIDGEKDATNEDGSILAQGIDQSKLVPLLVKTIQELEARITALENA